MVNRHLTSADEFNGLGLQIMNRHDGYTDATMLNRFRSWFGTSPEICEILWARLNISGWTDFSGVRPAHPMYLLWALLFLKSYGTEALLSAVVGADEKTYRKWVWFYVKGIASLHGSIVSIQ